MTRLQIDLSELRAVFYHLHHSVVCDILTIWQDQLQKARATLWDDKECFIVNNSLFQIQHLQFGINV
jgi:hypothetical protein